MSENGNKEAQLNVDQIVLNRDRATGAVSIGGNVTDIDLILDMLGRALRHTDVQFRILAATQAQGRAKAQTEEFNRIRSLMGR